MIDRSLTDETFETELVDLLLVEEKLTPDVLNWLRSSSGMEREAPTTVEAITDLLQYVIPADAFEFSGMNLFSDETKKKWEQYLDVRLKYLERAGLILSHRQFSSLVGRAVKEDFSYAMALKTQTFIVGIDGKEWEFIFTIC